VGTGIRRYSIHIFIYVLDETLETLDPFRKSLELVLGQRQRTEIGSVHQKLSGYLLQVTIFSSECISGYRE